MMFNKILVANRSEIAIRVFRAAHELHIPSVGIYSAEDRLTLHRFNTRESYRVGEGKGPIEAYLDMQDIIRIAKLSGSDAIHPGYGFLSENPDFAHLCAESGITFIGPPPEIMRRLGNKVEARRLAIEAGVPVMPATDPLPESDAEVVRLANEIGCPLMLKASWGGGGRGMRVIEDESDLLEQVAAARRCPPRRSADHGRLPRPGSPPVRARLHRAATAPEDRGTGAFAVPVASAAR
jgi:pyruvate carboxylase